ncbi:MAG TPA: YSC84-related protein [Hyphomicrobiaceae bacterium]|jgi:lipid-binding SYLF domain-containing protein|nr:YSC84-related protein [Hyphomicrobiaceae bacterium]
MLGLALVATLASAGAVPRSEAASAARIDANVRVTLNEFFSRVRGSRELVSRSAAVLVFPSVIKAGIGIGGEYGEGALLTRERTIDYYNIVSGSIGVQFGAQARSVIIVFVTPEALAAFRRTSGWKAGVDASVAIITVGAGGSIDTSRIASPVIGFVFDGTGLMFNLTLDGTKITQIQR